MKVLLTDGEQRATLAAARSLSRFAEVHVAGPGSNSLAGASRAVRAHHDVPDSLLAPDAFFASVQALASRLGVEVVLPVSDGACRILLARRDDLAPGLVLGPSFEAYERVSDKAEVAFLAESHGLALPAGALASDANQAADIARRLGFPVVVKPVTSIGRDERGGLRKIGPARVDDEAGLRAVWRSLVGEGRALVQRFVPGWGEGVFLLRVGGTTRAVFAHRRLREKPPAGGIATLSESIDAAPERVKRVEAVLDEVGFEGVAMAEFRTDGERAWLMEFNARLWGSLQLAIDCGVDFPRLWVEAVRGAPAAPPPPYPIGSRSRQLLGELDHALALARGQVDTHGRTGWRAALEVLWKPAGERVHWAVLRADDPQPFVYEARRWLGSAVRSLGRGR